MKITYKVIVSAESKYADEGTGEETTIIHNAWFEKFNSFTEAVNYAQKFINEGYVVKPFKLIDGFIDVKKPYFININKDDNN